MNRLLTNGLLSIVLTVVMIGSCKPSEEEIQAQVLAQYDIKVAALKTKKHAECQVEALRLAEIIADSIVYNFQINPLSDPLYQPIIPSRPDYIPVDSSVFDSKRSVKPIL